MVASKDKYIASAYQKLQVISQDKQKRLEYEAREKAIRDYNQSMFEAKESGREEGIDMITATTTATEMQNNFGKYLNLVMSGQEIIVTKNNREVGRFIPKDAAYRT